MIVPGTYGLLRPENRNSDGDVLLKMMDDYQKTVQPGVKIEMEEMVVPAGQVVWDAIRLRAQAGNISDVVAFPPVTNTMNSDLFYQYKRSEFDVKNPYSSNAHWWDDFPSNGVVFSGYPGAIPNTYWGVGLTESGSGSLLGIQYNRDLFDKAGLPVGRAPTSWAEMASWHDALKSKGIIPWDMANNVSGTCCSVWFHNQVYGNLIEDQHEMLEKAAADFFGEKPDGMLNTRWAVYLLKTGKWTLDNEQSIGYLNVIKDWSDSFQPGFLGQTTTDYFLSGQAAMRFVYVTNIKTQRRIIGDKLKWGTFYFPPITRDTWPKAPGLPQRVHGANGLPGAFVNGAFWMISQKAVKEGHLDLINDFLMWMTAPDQLSRWAQEREPRSAPSGTLVKDVYPGDIEMQEQYRFHYEPQGIRNGKRYGIDFWHIIVGVGGEVSLHKVNQAFLSGQLSAEQAAAAQQAAALESGQRWIDENPDVTPPASQWK